MDNWTIGTPKDWTESNPEQYTPSNNNDWSSSKNKEFTSGRPTAITVVCTLLAVALVINLLAIPTYLQYSRYLPGWFTLYAFASLGAGVAAMGGLWFMKQWSVWLYGLLTLGNQIALAVAGAWNFWSLILPAIIFIVALTQVEDMD